MKRKLRRLFFPHLQYIFEIGVACLTLVELATARLGWLRPWLLPERREPDVSKTRFIGDQRQGRRVTPFGLLLWGVAIYIFAYLSVSVDPRPGLILAAEYGLAVAVYIYLRVAGRIKKSLV